MSKPIYSGDYLQGKFIKCKDPNGTVSSVNPGNLDAPTTSIPFSYEHIHLAVAAAQTSYKTWQRQKPSDRIAALVNYAKILGEASPALAAQMSSETGRPRWECSLELSQTLVLIDNFVESAKTFNYELKTDARKNMLGFVRYHARGVFAVISPSVQPLLLPHSYFVPALIHGNAVILKGSRHAPLCAQMIAECMHQAGIPSGIFNLVQGNAEVARRLVMHPGVDGVFFSGSEETAQKVHKQLSDNLTKTLVLGVSAKNSAIIWKDATFDKALRETLFAAFVSAGQRCTSTGRILVHTDIFDKFVAGFHALAKRCRIGYGLDEARAPFMGPLISEVAVENYLRYQGIAVREGCEELMRGKILEKEKKGYYVSPSIHIAEECNLKSIYQMNEVSGPDVVFYRISDLDEIAQIVRAPGLVTSVYSSRENYVRVLDEIQMGLVNWNLPTTEVNYALTYGGPNGSFRPMGATLAHHQCLFPTASLECPIDHRLELPAELPQV